MLGRQYPDYDVNIDYSAMFNAFSMTLKASNEEGSSGDPVVIQPIPWENAPAADCSTEEFTRRLEECEKFMDHFAMHTPHYFLTHSPNSAPCQGTDSDQDPYSDGAPEAFVDKPNNEATKKRRGKGKETRRKKQKACQEMDRGLHSSV